MRSLCAHVPIRADQPEQDAIRDVDSWGPLTVHDKKLQCQVFEHLLSPLASEVNHSLSLIGSHVQLQPVLPGSLRATRGSRSAAVSLTPGKKNRPCKQEA